MRRFSLLDLSKITATTALLCMSFVSESRAAEHQRVVSAGGSITEIVYALGQEHRLVARDTTSNYPEAAHDLPNVGYVRRLSAEGLLSVDPDLILVEEGGGPPETLDVIRETAIPVITVPLGFDRDAVEAKIKVVAEALDVEEKGRELASQVLAEIDAAVAESQLNGKRVMFVLALQGGRILAAGQNNAAEGMIHMAGAENAVQGFEGYKLLTDEAVIMANPDIILVMNSRRGMDLSDEALLANPTLASTKAGVAGAILRMDGMFLLGFSVRTGQAVRALAGGLQNVGS
ncbi:hemin ABC transporter substrate-binding protein [Shimia sp. CNT1-13L.2]|uniref:heme/hemin ABC transporter substrate-binding protein n=1 Tax=Shimia sp. CNT1-13L.2 TaxID=2959663 RepID=UPI0020CF0AA9|nr:hemin ABC transporter substrate-binding protein [Shimia sp. CNT1-13L.2]MCP9484103.1 hemin ABC transporter substrate-binding protein [Shimia sp. CNT1-13L.2]